MAFNVSVHEGDLIGVLLPSMIIESPINVLLCPSRPNLENSEGTCSSAFFHPMDDPDMVMDVIPTSEFTEVLVTLNIQATIVPGKVWAW